MHFQSTHLVQEVADHRTCKYAMNASMWKQLELITTAETAIPA